MMRGLRRHARLLLGALALGAAARAQPLPPSPFDAAIAAAQERVVKLYGARVGLEKGYGSGVLVSADGQIVTALTGLLEATSPRVVLADGRSFAARVVRRDERRQLALLKIEADSLPHFALDDPPELQPGDLVVAASNAFKVADGPEPVSVMLGVLSARTTLAGRHRAQDAPYAGTVLLTDIVTSTPGSAGGALVDGDGALVGVIGRPLIGTRTATWLNYALPVQEVAAFVRGEDPAESVAAAPEGGGPTLRLVDLGLRLFDVGGRVRPAYVERVRPGSPAQRAGLRADDLIIAVDGQTVAGIDDCRAAIEKRPRSARVQLALKRGEEIVTVELVVAGDAR